MAVAAAWAAAAFAAVKVAAVKVITALAFKAGIGAGLAMWGKVALYASMGASLLMKPPGLASNGVQVNVQPAGPSAPLPIVLGRTRTQGYWTYREAYRDVDDNTDKNNRLGFETVVSVGPVKSISDYRLTGHRIYFNRDPLRLADAQELRDQGDDDAADAIIREIAAPHLDAMCEALPGLRDQLVEHFKTVSK